MRNHTARRNKAKLAEFKTYMSRMNDYVSSSEEEDNQTAYKPQVDLQLEDQTLTVDYDQLVQEGGSRFASEQEEDAIKSEVPSEQCMSSKRDSAKEQESSQIGKDSSSNRTCLKLLKCENESASNLKVKIQQQLSSPMSHEVKKKQQRSLKQKESEDFPIKQTKQQVNQQSNDLKTSPQLRKKNNFMSKQQKKKLQYDIKSQRFLLPDLMSKYCISRSTIKRYLSQINSYGQILIPLQKTRVVSGSKQNRIINFIRQGISKNPFLSQKQMAMMIKEQMNVEVSQQTVSLMLRKLNITKKKGMVTYKEGNTELGIEQRYQYAKVYQSLNESKVIFMDETGFNQCVEVEYGYAPRGKRLLKEKSGKKGHKIVVILSMTYDRLCHWDIVNLSVKTEDVAAYIKKFSREFRGYSLIMDNAKVHKTHEVSEAVASVGLIPIFLPPYTPQLNPIQLIFGRLKTIYKNRMGVKMQQPQTQLSQRVHRCLETLSESKLENYKRPVGFWIKQALNRRKFNEATQQSD